MPIKLPKIRLKKIIQAAGHVIGVADKSTKKANEILTQGKEIKSQIEELKKLKDNPNPDLADSLIKQIEQIGDILDDGKDNDSYDLPNAWERAISIIVIVIPVISYVIYAIQTGDFSLTELLSKIG